MPEPKTDSFLPLPALDVLEGAQGPVADNAGEALPLMAVLRRSGQKFLSWSQVQMMLRCGEQYRRRYINGERIPPGIAQLIGTGTHVAIRTNLQAKLSGKDVNLAYLSDVVDTVMDRERREKGLNLQHEEAARGEAVVWTEAKAAARACAHCHKFQVAPHIVPEAVESERAVQPPLEGLPLLVGVLDIVERLEGATTPIRVRDTKTSRRTPPANAAHASDQLTAYAYLLAYSTRDRVIPHLRIDSLVIQAKDPLAPEVRYVPLDTVRTLEHLESFGARLAATALAITKGVFLPCLRDAWWCDARWCGYYPTCPYVRGTITMPVPAGPIRPAVPEKQRPKRAAQPRRKSNESTRTRGGTPSLFAGARSRGRRGRRA